MSDIAIRVENLSKLYHIGGKQERYRTLRDTLTDAFMGPVRKFGGLLRGRATAAANLNETIWALNDISFEVKKGEVMGIIGRNGAGKSTLLKVLSRITEPTKGCAEMHGRVGSLLEVGTGFHPELTGRENIFLNGAILGMKRTEIERKFDAIVAFAEVEKFIDTPVKHYSSGMHVRLAFAVAAYLEPEILLVDEVLAVGDAKFQSKCLGKMRDIGKQGRTVLFVSHAMAAVQSLCSRGSVLESGQLIFDGFAEDAIYHYLRTDTSHDAIVDLSDVESRRGNGDLRLRSFWVEDESGMPVLQLRNNSSCTFVIGFEVCDSERLCNGLTPTIVVKTVWGTNVFYHHNFLTGQSFDQVGGSGEFRLYIPRLPLAPGKYVINLSVSTDTGRTLLDEVEAKATMEVIDGDFFGKGFEYRGGSYAVCAVDGSWAITNGVKPLSSSLKLMP